MKRLNDPKVRTNIPATETALIELVDYTYT